MLVVRRFAGCLLFLVLSAAAQETNVDRSQRRGPKESVPAVGTNLALPWSNGQPPLLWRARLGEGYSGTAVAEERAYTQMQTRAGQYVVCLDLASGRLLWRTRCNFPWQTGGEFPGPYATPVCKSGKVYYADCQGQAGCLDARSGRTLWTVNLTRKFQGEGTGSGYACSPLVDEERVILPVGGRGASVVACSTRDGSVLWKSGDDAASYSSTLAIQVQGHRQVVSFLQNALVAHDPLTGRELWRDRWNSPGYDEHNTAPLYQEPYIFCAASFKSGARVLKLGYESGRAKAELVWQSQALCNDIFSSVIVGGFIYGSGVEQIEVNPDGGTRSQFKCLELTTGRVAWSSVAHGHASVLFYDDKLFLVNESGVLIVVEPSPAGYRELARSQVVEGKKPCWTTPSIYQGRLLVRNQEMLACYQIGSLPPGADPGTHAKGLESTIPAGYDFPASLTTQSRDCTLLEHQSCLAGPAPLLRILDSIPRRVGALVRLLCWLAWFRGGPGVDDAEVR